jgi:hypothetical protein
MRAGAGKFNMPQALTTDAREGYFDTALVANYAAVLHPLVLAAQTLPIGYRAEYTGTEKSVALGFEGAVIDGLRLGDFTV